MRNDSALLAASQRIEAVGHFQLFHFKPALASLNEALEVYQGLNDTIGIVSSLTAMAEIEAYTGHNYQSLTKLEKALSFK
ncbi:MAG: hypothetical protein U5L96_21345 [Owenweeksia sp.]|nr:hypothetical protein [Owenweeksia sp.]